MREQWNTFYKARREYEMKLALFIYENYEELAEYRWRYILEYNKLKVIVSTKNQRKERELVRLLQLISAESILTKDVVP